MSAVPSPYLGLKVINKGLPSGLVEMGIRKEPTSWDSKPRDSKQGVCGGSSFLSSVAILLGKYSNLVWHMKISSIIHNLICSYKKENFYIILPELLRFSQGSA